MRRTLTLLLVAIVLLAAAGAAWAGAVAGCLRESIGLAEPAPVRSAPAPARLAALGSAHFATPSLRGPPPVSPTSPTCVTTGEEEGWREDDGSRPRSRT